MSDASARLEIDGYCTVPSVLTNAEVAACIAEWTTICRELGNDPAILKGDQGEICGARNLVRIWPNVISILRRPPLREFLAELLGAEAGLVRGLYFDKPPGHGWALP